MQGQILTKAAVEWKVKRVFVPPVKLQPRPRRWFLFNIWRTTIMDRRICSRSHGKARYISNEVNTLSECVECWAKKRYVVERKRNNRRSDAALPPIGSPLTWDQQDPSPTSEMLFVEVNSWGRSDSAGRRFQDLVYYCQFFEFINSRVDRVASLGNYWRLNRCSAAQRPPSVSFSCHVRFFFRRLVRQVASPVVAQQARGNQ